MKITLIRSAQIDGKWSDPGTEHDVAVEIARPLIALGKAKASVRVEKKEIKSGSGKRG